MFMHRERVLGGGGLQKLHRTLGVGWRRLNDSVTPVIFLLKRKTEESNYIVLKGGIMCLGLFLHIGVIHALLRLRVRGVCVGLIPIG